MAIRHAQEPADVAPGYSLVDRYRNDSGRVFLSGSQALARLPFEQLRVDRLAGWNTAAYVTGYPGSPLAGFDKDVSAVTELARADGYELVFQPGLNEELAATAVMGSQLAVNLDSCKYDGVIGIWYGKAPGLDRASDAMRHAVFAGTSSRGGAVALVGDDPAAKSSTLPSSSDATLVDLHIPVLYPGDVQEALDLGRHAIALSRACGLWTSIKVVEAVADGTGTVELHPERIVPVIPTMEWQGKQFVPHPSGQLITPYTIELEREFHLVRLELARRYGVDNHLNTIAVRGPQDWIGIVATGHTYRETLEALRLLGLRTEDDLRDAGIRLLKLGLPVPLDPALIRQFAAGLIEVVVVEEKNPTLEWFVKDALYSQNERPVVTGKHAPDGSLLLPATGTLEADTILPSLRARLGQRLADRLVPEAPLDSGRRTLIPLSVNRTPFFCSGCPHNSSTKTPEGTLVGAGIGCHGMVMLMEPERVGNLVGITAMGNEGSQWFGMAPFVEQHHLIQNIGDGTLFHSGMLSVRAAVANGCNITYKILYNGAVAMTGGQDPFGQLTVPALTTVLLAEGVRKVLVTTEDVDRYRSLALPDGVEVWDRSRIVEAQELLAKVPGTTVLIHDQRCAAENRRDRKRNLVATPKQRVLIDHRVCEGCGHCGEVSNCLSVQPIDTPFGRKTRIDQASCNLDFSCLKGDCPSFMTIEPRDGAASRLRTRLSGRRASVPQKSKKARAVPTIDVTSVPDPVVVVDRDDSTVRFSGIGGTGVVTVAQILGTAAMLDGFHVRGLDQTGLSQKAGPVVSDVRMTRDAPRASNKASDGSVDALIAFDLLVAASDKHLTGASPSRTIVIASTTATPTGSMVIHPATVYPGGEAMERLSASAKAIHTTDAVAAVTDTLRDASTANVYLLGVAVQRGAVPVSPAAVERAIDLNGVAVERNIAAFRLGRRDAHQNTEAPASLAEETTDEMAARLEADLVDYQSDRYARRYRELVDSTRQCGSDAFTRAVAFHLHKVMAYKDEYEVARLLLRPESRAAAEAIGGPGAKVHWNLHPPILRAMGMQRKIRLGRWATPVFRALRAGKRVRGTPVDVFGWASIRRLERTMVREYMAAVRTLVERFDRIGEAEAVAIASLPASVRGYEEIKRPRAEAYRAELESRLAAPSR